MVIQDTQELAKELKETSRKEDVLHHELVSSVGFVNCYFLDLNLFWALSCSVRNYFPQCVNILYKMRVSFRYLENFLNSNKDFC